MRNGARTHIPVTISTARCSARPTLPCFAKTEMTMFTLMTSTVAEQVESSERALKLVATVSSANTNNIY